MTKRHRFPAYKIAAITATLVADMVEGKYGHVPGNGVSGKRSTDGGFYERIQLDMTKRYGHTIGQGTINKCRVKALPYTSTTIAPRDSTAVGTSLKIRRLRSANTKRNMSNDQNATVSGIYAFSKEADLRPNQLSIINDFYKRFHKNKK